MEDIFDPKAFYEKYKGKKVYWPDHNIEGYILGYDPYGDSKDNVLLILSNKGMDIDSEPSGCNIANSKYKRFYYITNFDSLEFLD